MAAVRESQEKMWRAIDDMTTEVQEMVERDASTNGGEETEPMPVIINLAEKELALEVEFSIPPLP